MEINSLITAASSALIVSFAVPLMLLIGLVISKKIKLFSCLRLLLLCIACTMLSNALSYLGQYLEFLPEKAYIIVFSILSAVFNAVIFMFFSSYVKKHFTSESAPAGYIFGTVKEWSIVLPVVYYDLVIFYRIINGSIYDVLSAEYSANQIQEIVSTYTSLSPSIFFYLIFKVFVLIFGYYLLLRYTTTSNNSAACIITVLFFHLFIILCDYTNTTVAVVLLLVALVVIAAVNYKPYLINKWR